MLTLISPVERLEPFNHADWLFEPKFDGFRAATDTANGRLISRNGNRMQRFEELLDRLPKGCVIDGELVVLENDGRPLFNALLFSGRRPIYVAFDLLIAEASICGRCRSGSARRHWRPKARPLAQNPQSGLSAAVWARRMVFATKTSAGDAGVEKLRQQVSPLRAARAS